VPKGAAFALDVERTGGVDSLVLSVPDPTRVIFRATVRAKDVNAAVDHLRVTLEKIHDIAGNSLQLTPQQSSDTVDAMNDVAPGLAYGLFRGQPLGRFYEIARLRSPAALVPAHPPRIVEVRTPEDFAFPFELLPWQLLPRANRDPAIRARCLLGMSAIVRRRLDEERRTAWGRIENHPVLPVTVFRHENLTAADREIDYLNKAGDVVDLNGPWPRPGQNLPPTTAVRHLLDSREGLDDATRRTTPVAVLHLACHCDTKNDAVSQHFLDLGGPHGTISYADLTTQASTPEAWSAARPRPLVFLNACGSAAPHLADRTSFTQFFIDQDFIGVLGTLCDISDEVAAHFAMVFYEALLRGRTVGEAMYDARWHLMDRHLNPLGLLYTYYGNPDLKLATSHAGAVVPACQLGAPQAAALWASP
jgi:hypothetical protein